MRSQGAYADYFALLLVSIVEEERDYGISGKTTA